MYRQNKNFITQASSNSDAYVCAVSQKLMTPLMCTKALPEMDPQWRKGFFPSLQAFFNAYNLIMNNSTTIKIVFLYRNDSFENT